MAAALVVSQLALPLALGAAPAPGQEQPGPTAGLGLNPGSRAADGPQDDSGASDRRYLVEFAQFGPQAVQSVRAAGGEVIHEFPRLGVIAAKLPDQALRGLQANPNVKSIEADPRRYPMALWNDDAGAPYDTEITPYGVKMVQANQVAYTGTANRKVCIIDSGYYMDHVDLPDGSKVYEPGKKYPGDGSEPLVYGSWDSNTGNWYEDGHGHGTHVAGTIAALTGTSSKGVVGVMPSGNIKLHIVRVFDDSGSWAYSSDLIAALDRCREYNANIVSMSLGGSFKSTWEDSAFTRANNEGILSIAAAGNGGNTRTSYPAGYDAVVSVAAVDADENHASFSQRNSDVEVAAPGVQVLSSLPYRENNTLAADGKTYYGNWIEYAPRTAGVSGTLVSGGLCDSVGSWSGKVVLCERGSISFKDKVLNVQSGGGVAAVIYNNTSGNFSGTLQDGTGVTIPAISLSQEDGQFLLANKIGLSGTVVSQSEEPANGYDRWDGTSMATPHVSAVAALAWSHNPSWTNAQIREALQRTAKDKGATGKDNAYGHGIVQAKAALEYLRATYGGGTADTTAPQVVSISRADANPTNATSVRFTVTFSESVTGVDAADFQLVASTDVTNAAVASVAGSGSSYTVTVNTGSGDGTLGLNLVDDDSIVDAASNKLGGDGTGNGSFTGEVYAVDKTVPTVSITAPASGATVSGTVTLSATADGTGSGVAGVQFKLGGANLGAEDTATPYEAQWDTSTEPNGEYTLTAVARDAAGNTATSATVTVTVSNAVVVNAMHVGSLEGSASTNGKNAWRATVTVKVVDASSQPVAGATVAGTWSNGASGSASCTTATDGTCSVTSGRIDNATGSVTFTVDNVSGTLAYDPKANVATSINVAKPTTQSSKSNP